MDIEYFDTSLEGYKGYIPQWNIHLQKMILMVLMSLY